MMALAGSPTSAAISAMRGPGIICPNVTPDPSRRSGKHLEDGRRGRFGPRARRYGPGLCRGCRLEPRRAAWRERPHLAIPRETDHVHLAGGSRARAFGDAPGSGVQRKNGRDRVRPPQNVARVVANATRRFGRETLAPDGGVERVAELTLECQRDAGGGAIRRPRPDS